jgi:hypothetical protein
VRQALRADYAPPAEDDTITVDAGQALAALCKVTARIARAPFRRGNEILLRSDRLSRAMEERDSCHGAAGVTGPGMIRSSDVYAALRLRYCAPEWALMFEVANGTGSSIRRYADAVAMNLFPSRGLELHGFEIKVSRGDWQRELKNPEKAETISQYCERWWIVAPKGLVQKEELPVTRGLLELEGDKLRIAVQAPLLPDRKPFSRPFIAALLRRSSEIDQAQVNKLVSAKVSEIRAQDVERNESAVKARTRDLTEKLSRVEAIEKAAGISLTDWVASAEIGHAIKAIRAAGLTQSWNGLQHLADNLKRHTEGIHREIDAVKATLILPETSSHK